MTLFFKVSVLEFINSSKPLKIRKSDTFKEKKTEIGTTNLINSSKPLFK